MILIEKALLNVKEFAKYLNIGETKARELLNDPRNQFTVRIGNRLYAHKGRVDKWLLNQIKDLFLKRLDYNYYLFKEKIPYPKLKIRLMKTRWGVCNRRSTTVTLNSKLIEYDIEKLDYVIIHELSHFIHFNHSKLFWETVSKYCTDYKRIRKELKD